MTLQALPVVYQWIQKLPVWLFPPTCLLCDASGEGSRDLCSGCHAELPYNTHACQRCATPLATDIPLICGQCQQQPPHFEQTFAPLRYQPPVDYLIQDLKFHGRLVVARLLGDLLSAALEYRDEQLPELIIPVPLHRIRLRERGFNQSLELARPVARRLGIALATGCVQRARHTTQQTRLSGPERRTNVRGAFVISQPIQASHVAILDDVVTTGSTVSEIAQVLHKAGVEKIEVWACARAGVN